MNISGLLKRLGVKLENTSSGIEVSSPIDGSRLARVKTDTPKTLDLKLKNAVVAFAAWRDVPAPKRGELIRLFGEELRRAKKSLGELVTLESGKGTGEGQGEVQEMIDICDFAVGLSRQLHGLTIASERDNHIMQESWMPLGPVGMISAFNFPVAVWAWNFVLAIVCGDTVVWKPSEKTPLTALACQALFEKALTRYGKAPKHLSQILLGDAKLGQGMVNDPRVALVSATGSVRMGKQVAPMVAQRLGKSLLELGGNNAIIVSDKADMVLALHGVLFGAVGTAGQRCTTTRRLFVQEKIYSAFFARLQKSYAAIAKTKIGDPRDPSKLVGPLIDKQAFGAMQKALRMAEKQGGTVLFGERVLAKQYPNAYYVEPALVKMPKQTAIVREETFAPILYVMPYKTLKQAVELNNAVPQGLSSSIFTTDLREAEYFKKYSDCGIANVNIGTSGAEIGGAFGGEKDTGGGRESGSDCWKTYMHRQTSTTYHGTQPPALAQGLEFNV
ncbi:MAG: aldehyde dehydrogenase family protein [Proteobacteria bacterium]|nr:aldehyde dehydrogenase family protein [Pseudomonadota bacterium]